LRRLNSKMGSSGTGCFLADDAKACVILADCAVQCDTAGSQIQPHDL